MSEWSPDMEIAWRLGSFLSIFAAMAVWESLSPRRRQHIPRVFRWSNNLALIVVDTVVVRITFPVLAVGVAIVAEQQGFGVFHFVGLPFWWMFFASLLLLDLALYLQHVLFHAVPGLWRLHRMHHADLEFDVTTGVRFHPIEIVLSMVIKLVIVGSLGAPAIAVLVFEILLNATSLFNHSNVRLPRGSDRVLRWLVVTPDMHRVHHSVLPQETNSNFGFNLPWWDRLLGTYRDQPRNGHEDMQIGLEQFRTRKDLRIDQMLIQPLRGLSSRYSINRHDDD